MLFSLQCSKDQNVHIYFGCHWCGAYDLCSLTNDTNAYWIQCDAIGKHVQQHARLCDMIHRIHIYANWTKQISGQDERDAHTKNILYSMRIPWEGGRGSRHVPVMNSTHNERNCECCILFIKEWNSYSCTRIFFGDLVPLSMLKRGKMFLLYSTHFRYVLRHLPATGYGVIVFESLAGYAIGT